MTGAVFECRYYVALNAQTLLQGDILGTDPVAYAGGLPNHCSLIFGGPDTGTFNVYSIETNV
jgi:hypothetical protein